MSGKKPAIVPVLPGKLNKDRRHAIAAVVVWCCCANDESPMHVGANMGFNVRATHLCSTLGFDRMRDGPNSLLQIAMRLSDQGR